MALERLNVSQIREELLGLRDSLRMAVDSDPSIVHACACPHFKRLKALVPADPDLVENVPPHVARRLVNFVADIDTVYPWNVDDPHGGMIDVCPPRHLEMANRLRYDLLPFEPPVPPAIDNTTPAADVPAELSDEQTEASEDGQPEAARERQSDDGQPDSAKPSEGDEPPKTGYRDTSVSAPVPKTPPRELLAKLARKHRQKALFEHLWEHHQATVDELHSAIWSDEKETVVENKTIAETARRLQTSLREFGYNHYRIEMGGDYISLVVSPEEPQINHK